MSAAVVQAKEENWNYATPELAGKVTTVGIGVDGTCMLICDQKWREAMTGSLSLCRRRRGRHCGRPLASLSINPSSTVLQG
jgi:hypothetical protein